MYIHDDSSVSFDELKLKVHCQEISNVVTLSFRILPSNYWKPLMLVANHTLYVEESTSIPVIKENLEVIYTNKKQSLKMTTNNEQIFADCSISSTFKSYNILRDGTTSIWLYRHRSRFK